MKTRWIYPQRPNLLVYFAGWGIPPDSALSLKLPADYGLLICYDYQDLSLEADFSPYAQIRVVAFSMGVWVAERAMQGVALQSATAVNGTGLPCDDRFGIPCAVFRGTLEQLNDSTRQKFEHRMCGDKAAFAAYQAFPARPLENLRAELTALLQHLQQDRRTDLLNWTSAWIGAEDRIFPAENQRRYWQGRCVLWEGDFAHYPFFQFNDWAAYWSCT